MGLHHIEEDYIVQSIQADFSFDSTIPIVVGTIPANSTIMEPLVVVSNLFNDVSATIRVGTLVTPDDLFNTAAVDITSPGYTIVPISRIITVQTTYQIDLEPAAASQGQGRLIIPYVIGVVS